LQATKDMSTPTINSSWKTAVDAASGKTYYYDVVTRRTQWEKVSCHDSLRDRLFFPASLNPTHLHSKISSSLRNPGIRTPTTARAETKGSLILQGNGTQHFD
jgi:hypothetical protein